MLKDKNPSVFNMSLKIVVRDHKHDFEWKDLLPILKFFLNVSGNRKDYSRPWKDGLSGEFCPVSHLYQFYTQGKF